MILTLNVSVQRNTFLYQVSDFQPVGCIMLLFWLASLGECLTQRDELVSRGRPTTERSRGRGAETRRNITK